MSEKKNVVVLAGGFEESVGEHLGKIGWQKSKKFWGSNT